MLGFIAFFLSFLTSCVSTPSFSVDSWAYQLQNANPSEMVNLDFDIYVIDYSRDGSEGGRYSREEIESLKRSGKIVLSYLSIVKFDPRVLEYVDGIGIEDLWYDGTIRSDVRYASERLKYIERFKKSGKIVLVVDYVDDGSGYTGENLRRIEDFVSKARNFGFIPYVARSDRELDELVVIKGVQPK